MVQFKKKRVAGGCGGARYAYGETAVANVRQRHLLGTSKVYGETGSDFDGTSSQRNETARPCFHVARTGEEGRAWGGEYARG